MSTRRSKRRQEQGEESINSLGQLLEVDSIRALLLNPVFFGLRGTWRLKLVSCEWKRFMDAIIDRFGSIEFFGGVPAAGMIVRDQYPAINTIARFHLRTMEWSLNSMPLGRSCSTAGRFANGDVIIAGGRFGSFEGNVENLRSSRTVMRRRGTTGDWVVRRNVLPHRLANARSCTLNDGRLIVMGGEILNGQEPFSKEDQTVTAGVFAISEDLSCTTLAPMTKPRTNFASAKLPDGRVIVAGGGYYGLLPDGDSSAELYDPETNTWSPITSMDLPNAHFGCLYRGNVLVFGDLIDGDEVNEATGAISSNYIATKVQRYDHKMDKWEFMPSMLGPRDECGLLEVAGDLIAVGGAFDNEMYETNGPGATLGIELYDGSTNTWQALSKVPSLENPRWVEEQEDMGSDDELERSSTCLPCPHVDCAQGCAIIFHSAI